jgi:hypothetical protein
VSALTRRTQVLLDDERYEQLRQRAEQTGSSVGSLIREAIDRALADDGERRREAAEAILNAEPMPVDDWPVMKREINEMYERSLQLDDVDAR